MRSKSFAETTPSPAVGLAQSLMSGGRESPPLLQHSSASPGGRSDSSRSDDGVAFETEFAYERYAPYGQTSTKLTHSLSPL